MNQAPDIFEPFIVRFEIEVCSKEAEEQFHQRMWMQLCDKVMDVTSGDLRAKINLVFSKVKIPPFAGKPRKGFDFLIAPAQPAPSHRNH